MSKCQFMPWVALHVRICHVYLSVCHEYLSIRNEYVSVYTMGSPTCQDMPCISLGMP
jgi:hypothetical protein